MVGAGTSSYEVYVVSATRRLSVLVHPRTEAFRRSLASKFGIGTVLSLRELALLRRYLFHTDPGLYADFVVMDGTEEVMCVT